MIAVNAKVYILLDIVDGKADRAVETLHGEAGVKMVDVLEGSPNVITMIQARNRQQLAELANQALASIDSLTEAVQILPTQNVCDARVDEIHTGRLQRKTLKQKAKSYGRAS